MSKFGPNAGQPIDLMVEHHRMRRHVNDFSQWSVGPGETYLQGEPDTLARVTRPKTEFDE